MRSLQELSDRSEIQDLIVGYSYAVDQHDWDALDEIFTPDATLDFTATGGERGDLPAIKAWFAKVLDLFAGHQHLVAASRIDLAGDTATARTLCHNPMWRNTDAGSDLLLVGLWYVDALVRTPDGWRIAERHQELGYLHGLRP